MKFALINTPVSIPLTINRSIRYAAMLSYLAYLYNIYLATVTNNLVASVALISMYQTLRWMGSQRA